MVLAANQPPYQSALRVLVVEDREEWRETLLSLLADKQTFATGEVFVVETAGTYGDARAAIINTYFDLIVLDLVLHPGPPGETEEWEGFWLLQDLFDLGLQEETAVIVLTSFDIGSVANLALTEFGALTFLSKDQPPGVLGSEIARVLSSQSDFGMRCGVSFAGGGSWDTVLATLTSAHLRRLTSPVSPDEAVAELDHLVRRVEQSATELEVAPMTPGYSGAVIARLARTRADGVIADTILKMGPAVQMREEQEKHERIVDFVQSHKTTLINGHAFGRHMGVLEYTLVGANEHEVVPFRRFYADSATTDVRACVDTLFRATCQRWYQQENSQEVTDFDLERYYFDEFGTSRTAVAQAYVFKFGPQRTSGQGLRLVDLPRPLPDPVEALVDGGLAAEFSTFLTLTHGDLHGENILVDIGTSDAWLIDFAAAGRGHWARDLATLECCIKFQYIDPHDLARLFEFEDALAVRGWAIDQSEAENWLDRPDLGKAIAVIGALRAIATDVVGDRLSREQMRREYSAALLFNTLNYLRFHSQLKRKTRKNQVLMAGGFALEGLSDEIA